jgi:hypothetical protein
VVEQLVASQEGLSSLELRDVQTHDIGWQKIRKTSLDSAVCARAVDSRHRRAQATEATENLFTDIV